MFLWNSIVRLFFPLSRTRYTSRGPSTCQSSSTPTATRRKAVMRSPCQAAAISSTTSTTLAVPQWNGLILRFLVRKYIDAKKQTSYFVTLLLFPLICAVFIEPPYCNYMYLVLLFFLSLSQVTLCTTNSFQTWVTQSGATSLQWQEATEDVSRQVPSAKTTQAASFVLASLIEENLADSLSCV